jgi:HK97 gp10 family phage protein
MAGDVKGAAAAMQRLKKLSTDLAAAASGGHAQLAEAAAEEMRANVPVDTGQLADTIRVERKNPFRTEVIVGDESTPYLGHVEFGTFKDQAQPFVRPAAGQAESVHGAVMLAHAKKRIK